MRKRISVIVLAGFGSCPSSVSACLFTDSAFCVFSVTSGERSGRLHAIRLNEKTIRPFPANPTVPTSLSTCQSRRMDVLDHQPKRTLANNMNGSAESATILDLFCGVGGFSLGAVRAGFRLVGSVDWDKDALRMHEVNFPESPHWKADLSHTSAKDIQKRFQFKQVDGIIGGPPCQGFSRMGHQRPDDSRNRLFVKFFSLVANLKPKFFLAENVLGLLDAKNQALVKRALSRVLPEYDVSPPLILTASRYGVPTTRTRVFIFGVRKDLGVKMSDKDILKGMPRSEKVTVAEALSGLPERIRATSSNSDDGGWRKLSSRCRRKGFFFKRIEGCIPLGVGDPTSINRLVNCSEVSGNQGTIHNSDVKTRWGKLKQGKQDSVSKARRLESNGFCHTIRAGTGRDMGSFQSLRPIHPTANRVITPREAARLQSFPDWFQFDSTKWQSFRQIGNSVCPVLAEKILVSIKSMMEKSDEKHS